MFRQELEGLQDRYPDRFRLIHVLSREAQGSELFTGRLDRDRLERILAARIPVRTVDEWYLCGPLDLVAGARGLLADLDVDPSHIHDEVFHIPKAQT